MTGRVKRHTRAGPKPGAGATVLNPCEVKRRLPQRLQAASAARRRLGAFAATAGRCRSAFAAAARRRLGAFAAAAWRRCAALAPSARRRRAAFTTSTRRRGAALAPRRSNHLA
jgi:hypothetical protein